MRMYACTHVRVHVYAARQVGATPLISFPNRCVRLAGSLGVLSGRFWGEV